MPVHAIPTSAGDALHWYERSGCVGYRGRLYFMINRLNNCHALLMATLNRELVGGEVLFDEPADEWRRGRWPVPDFNIVFQLISADTNIPDYRLCCFFICERPLSPWKRLRYIDHINPAFRRLQRWFRTVLWKNRQEQRLQFALAAHGWLHNDLVRVIGLLIK